MANYLFFAVNATWEYHFETDLEIMHELTLAGHQVFALVCDRLLPTCYSNPCHLKLGCIKCVARRNAGFKKINLPKKNIFYLKQTDIDTSIIPQKFLSQEHLESFVLNGLNLGKWVVSTLMKEDDEHFIDVEVHADRINKLLKTSYIVADNCTRILKQFHMDGVYLLNGRIAEYAAVVEVCKKLGINFFIHERAGVFERYFLGENYLPQELAPAAREIASLWKNGVEPERSTIAAQWFTSRRNKVQQGWIPFTLGQQDGKLPASWDPSKRNIAIFNGVLAEFLVFDEWRNTGGFQQNELMERIVLLFSEDNTFHFYLRIHPNLGGSLNTQMNELEALAKKAYKNLTIIWPADAVDTYELVERSEKVLTFGSTVGVESCFWGKASILWGRASYETLGCTYNPESFDEMCELIRANLEPKPKEKALPYGFWEMRRGVKFKHYKPLGLTTGTFQGVKIVPEFTLKDRLEIKLDAKISSLLTRFSKIKSSLRKGG